MVATVKVAGIIRVKILCGPDCTWCFLLPYPPKWLRWLREPPSGMVQLLRLPNRPELTARNLLTRIGSQITFGSLVAFLAAFLMPKPSPFTTVSQVPQG